MVKPERGNVMLQRLGTLGYGLNGTPGYVALRNETMDANGLGIAVLPHFLARPHGLTCLNADLGIDPSIWLVTQSDLAQSHSVCMVADCLRDLVKRLGALIS